MGEIVSRALQKHCWTQGSAWEVADKTTATIIQILLMIEASVLGLLQTSFCGYKLHLRKGRLDLSPGENLPLKV